MSKTRKSWLRVALFAATAVYSIPVSAEFAIRDGDKVAFLGDSITAARTYGKLIENYTLLRFPEREVTFINVGRGGETAAGAVERLQRDVFSQNVTLLTVAYGINDIGWGMRADEQHRQQYLDAIGEIVAACQQRGVRVYICSAAVTGQDPHESENSFLQKMCDEGMRIAVEGGAGAIDVQRTMRQIQKRVWQVNERADPDEQVSLHTEDTIHLNDLGQLAMAFAILKGLGAPAEVSAATIDAQRGTVLAAEDCQVSAVEKSDGQLQFTRLDKGLPFNNGVFSSLDYRFVPIPEELNRYLLTVKNLPPGQYRLEVSGRQVGQYSSQRLAGGVNIASATADPWLPGGPWDAQADVLKSLADARNTIDLAKTRIPERLGDGAVAIELTDGIQRASGRLRELQRTVAEPQPYRFTITRTEQAEDEKSNSEDTSTTSQ